MEETPRRPTSKSLKKGGDQNDQMEEKQGQAVESGADDDRGDGNDIDDTDSEKFGETEDASLTPDQSGRSGAGETMDRLARLRREKRLAMNRESARVRRKRKKVLLLTLEQQVEALTTRNQALQNANERLTTRVTKLEDELSLAHSTIAMFRSQVAFPSTASAGSSVFGPDLGGAQSNLRRLLQAQSQSLSQQGATLPLGGLHFDESMLLQRALDINMRQQPSLEAALENNKARIPPLPTTTPGLQTQAIHRNTLAMPQDLGLGEARLGAGTSSGTQTSRLLDALSGSSASTSATAQQMLQELLKQRGMKF